MLLEVLSEFLDISDKVIDTKDQIFLEHGLLTLQVISDVNSLLNKLSPVLVKNCTGISFFRATSKLWKICIKQIIHINDWSEIDFDFRFLLSDLLKSLHNIAKGIDIFGWLLDLEFDLLDVIGQVLKECLGSLVKILGVSILPHRDPLLQTRLDVLGLETEGTDLVEALDLIDVEFEVGELFKFLLEVLKLRV